MFEYIMSEERHILLESLTGQSVLKDFYLAGGTAAALYLGHRWSQDLDFFTGIEFDPLQLAEKLAKLEGFLLTGQEPGTLHCFVNNVKVSFLYYPYPLVGNLEQYREAKLAPLEDIALMKLVAMVQRGTRKDFVDLYFLDKEKVAFEEMLQLFPQKYPAGTFQPLVILKALGYFSDAEKEDMPKMFCEVSWQDIKTHLLMRQKELAVGMIQGK